MRKYLAADEFLRKVKISDANILVKEGVLQMSVKNAQELIRVASLDNGVDGYIGENIYIQVTSSADDISRKMIKIYSLISDEHVLFECMDELMRKLFFKEDARKVSILITSSEVMLDEVLCEIGFMQEALLRDEICKVVDGRKVYEDAGLYSIQRSEYKGYNVCFVPFQRGVVAITGGITYVDGLYFLSYEEAIEDSYIAECAWYQGITDDDAKVLSRKDYPWDMLPEEFSFMPAELIRANEEVKEYFHKQRQNFDISVKIHESTPFQLQVWDKLKSIPYGVTVSYEDIALEISDNDLQRARKLTRAVGKACSENPVPIIVPCHRVIGKNGRLVGFSGGIEFKDFLLQNELFATALPLN